MHQVVEPPIIKSLREHFAAFAIKYKINRYLFRTVPAIGAVWIEIDQQGLSNNYFEIGNFHKDIRISDKGVVDFFLSGKYYSTSNLKDPNCIKSMESFILN